MKLAQYIKALQGIEKQHGGDLDLVYSIDDEGNAFHQTHYTPTVGYFSNNDFDGDSDKEPNSVCLN